MFPAELTCQVGLWILVNHSRFQSQLSPGAGGTGLALLILSLSLHAPTIQAELTPPSDISPVN